MIDRPALQVAPIVNCWTNRIISIIILLFSVENPSQKIEDSFWYDMRIVQRNLAHFDFQGVTRFLFASHV